MDELNVRIRSERDDRSPNKWFGVYVTVNGDAVATERGIDRDILDVDVFFNSFHVDKRMPLFTCLCGFFGCGGYYVGVSGDDDAWILRDWYGAQDEERHGRFEYRIPWSRVRQVATNIIDEITALKAENPAAFIRCGHVGVDIGACVEAYKKRVDTLL